MTCRQRAGGDTVRSHSASSFFSFACGERQTTLKLKDENGRRYLTQIAFLPFAAPDPTRTAGAENERTMNVTSGNPITRTLIQLRHLKRRTLVKAIKLSEKQRRELSIDGQSLRESRRYIKIQHLSKTVVDRILNVD